MIAGVALFLTVGAIGWVSGPLFGALGLFALATGGALGGLGLGAIVHVMRHPEQYDYSVPTIFAVLIVGGALACWVARWIGRRLARDGSAGAFG